MIDSASKVVLHDGDLHEHLVETPASMQEMAHHLGLASTNFGRKNRPEPALPEPHRLVRDVDARLVQQVLDVPQRKQVADVHYHC